MNIATAKQPTTTANFRSGYACGLTWAENYRPGGPWVPRNACTPKQIEIRQTALLEVAEWFAGFDAAKPNHQDQNP